MALLPPRKLAPGTSLSPSSSSCSLIAAAADTAPAWSGVAAVVPVDRRNDSLDKREPDTLRRWPLALLPALPDRVRAAGAVGSASLGLGLGFWFWPGFEFAFGLLGTVVVVVFIDKAAAGLVSWPPSSIGAAPRARTG